MNQLSSSSENLPACASLAGHVRVAIVAAQWHADIVQQAVQSCAARLAEHVPQVRVDCFEVPGAFEIPLHVKTLANKGHYDAIVACGLVVDGGIYRHDFVESAVIDGLMRVQLDTEVPVFSVVLTPHHFHEHEDHRHFFCEHFSRKGREAADACVATLVSLRRLRD